MSKPSLLRATLTGVALSLLVTGCFDTVNRKPSFVPGDVLRVDYDGITDDLLTAGLGQTGLAGALPPALQDPENPTAAELRRLAIYNNYRAIVDTAPGGGYGTLFGPGVGAADPEGLVAGREYLAYADDGTGKDNVVLMVQVPASFDPARPCIVAGPSSGSRGIYGAIGSAGEWGLKKGCAVAYTDKGTGMGVHDLTAHKANAITGEQQAADTLGKAAHFTAIEDEATRHAFLQTSPHRVAFKHAHSTRNPEKDWGVYVLQSIELAFYVLNLEENFGRRGVAVSEPNVNPPSVPELVIRQGNVSWDADAHSRPLLAYTALLNVLAPCAVLAPSMQGAPLAITPATLGTNRCESLHTKGILQADTVETQAVEALDKLHQAGLLDDSDLLLPSHHALSVYESVGFTYTSAYGRFGVTDAVCGFSFAGLDAPTLTPGPVPSAELAKIFGTSNGVPPSGAVYLFNDHSVGGPLLSRYSVSLSTQKQDQNLDGALCMLALATGQTETGASLTGAAADRSERGRAHRDCPRSQRRLAPRQPHVSRVLRGEQAVGRRDKPRALLRGDERAAPGRAERDGGLRREVHSAAPLLQPGDGPDVGAPHDGGGAAGEPSGAYDGARQGQRGRGATSYVGAPAGHRVGTLGVGPNHDGGHDAGGAGDGGDAHDTTWIGASAGEHGRGAVGCPKGRRELDREVDRTSLTERQRPNG
jgi:hydroxybutyrate-dimer hydrolase